MAFTPVAFSNFKAPCAITFLILTGTPLVRPWKAYSVNFCNKPPSPFSRVHSISVNTTDVGKGQRLTTVCQLAHPQNSIHTGISIQCKVNSLGRLTLPKSLQLHYIYTIYVRTHVVVSSQALHRRKPGIIFNHREKALRSLTPLNICIPG